MKKFILSTLVLATLPLRADPQLTSWFTANSGKYARIYKTTADQTSQTTSTTWSNGSGVQSNPAYSGVHEINYSANWIYIRTTGLASHVMGPWYLDSGKTQLFPNYPSNTSTVYRIPRSSTIGAPPAAKALTGNGAIGFFVNGVAFFDNRDAFSYKNSSATDATPVNHLTGDGIWNRNAYANELVTFDAALAHQAGNQYHYHVNPIALRYQLNDHVTYNATANTYAEAATTAAHSPILAWAADGYPVYGPYGYSDPTNASSSVRRMVSGFVARNGSNGTTNLSTTGRTTLPAWAASAQGISATLASGQYGPNVNATYTLGHYIEDYDYLGNLGYTQTTGSTVRDFDLDQYNGRFCVTPEFPAGTYAYFSTIDSSNAPAFPYNIGRQFYGNVTGSTTTAATMNADTPLTQQFIGGANTAITINTPSVSGTSVTLTWSATEGGTYSVDASPNSSTWTSRATGIVSSGTSANSTYTALGTSGTEYGRVNRTALATYDTAGQTAATVSQTKTTSYTLGGSNVAPTLSTINTFTGAFKNTAFTISYATLLAASNAADANGDTISFRIEAVSSGTLTKNGSAVTAGSTLISSGDSVVWTPATNASGTLAAFTVKAYDGSLASNTAVQVNVSVASNTAPTLTTINSISGATEDTAFTISYATLLSASNAADADGDAISFQIQAVSSGTLTKNSVAVTAGSTLISSGDSVVWTPAANANGTLTAFTVKAYDGQAASSTAVQVNVTTTAVNDAPTLTSLSTLTGAVKNTAFTISYATLLAASNAADVDGGTIQFRIEAVNMGTLTKNNVAVTAGSTTITTGDSLVWTPATDYTGTAAAFSVKAYDGTLASSTAVTVNITVSTSDPQLSSWYVAQTGRYARIYETDAALNSGTTSSTWTRTTGQFTLAQTSPAYAGPQQIDYSTSWIYIRTPSLATYTMGPWYNDANRTTLFQNVPKNQGLILRIPRSGTLGAIPSTKTQMLGLMIGGVLQPAAGYLVDGVCIFDPSDGFSYASGTESSPGTGVWHRDAYVNESATFDKSLAHQQNTGVYHNHVNPLALRYQLGDAVSYNNVTKTYTESLAPAQHSPVIGWMIDGLPIYGPYGYSSPLDSASGVRRMIGGFVKRDGATTGVDNISTTGSTRTLPQWATRNGATNTNGPSVSSTYPFGRYLEDWSYLGDLQKSAGVSYQLGIDFDLNEYNVRYCVTPEFPNGTWAYFLNIKSAGAPQFPYICNRWFYGSPTGGTVTSVAETVTNQFMGGANRPLGVTNANASGTTVTLTWNAVEGGTYSVDASQNQSTWTSKATGIAVSNANSASSSYTALGTSGTEYGRVNRTALASYDSTGTTAATVSQTATSSYVVVPQALAVTPSSGLASSGPAGGSFSPASASYTLTNTGTGTLAWSASKTAAWFDLSATSGTLSAGASTTVNATINSFANNLTAGNFSDTITFTNNTNGTGNTTRGVSLAVLSTNANLSALALSSGTLSPVFSSSVTAYTATVANSISSLTVTPTTQDSSATVTVNGNAVTSGSTSGAITLTVGDNAISTVVAPQNGTPTKTYTITVTRQSSMQTWRQTWYGTGVNSGNAADLADPYHTGYSNLAVFAFFGPGQDPASAGSLQLPQPTLSGGNFTYSFIQPSGVTGITYGAQWSTSMSGNDWHDIPETGSGSQHVFSIPIGNNTRTFMRLQVTGQ